MSETSEKVPYPLGENTPEVIRHWAISNLEGKFLTLVETFGFDEKREKAIKSMVKNEIWRWLENNRLAQVDKQLLHEAIRDNFMRYQPPYETKVSEDGMTISGSPKV